LRGGLGQDAPTRPSPARAYPGNSVTTQPWPAGYDQPDRGDGQRLWNLAPRIPAEQRYTRIHRGRRELIDHLLASHLVTRRIADGDVITGGPTPASAGDDPNVRRDSPASDHRLVIASIDP
jgi:hypothetical protein